MPQAMPLTTRVSQGSTRSRKERMLSAQFGDGYGQDVADGTNAQVDEWNITFDNLNLSDRATVLAVLDAVGGTDYITWTAQGDSTEKKWKVKGGEYQESWVSGDHSTISFTLKQWF